MVSGGNVLSRRKAPRGGLWTPSVAIDTIWGFEEMIENEASCGARECVCRETEGWDEANIWVLMV